MYRIILSLWMPVFFLAVTAKAQEFDSSIVVQAIETKNYVFKAQTASPQRGGSRQLSPEYDFVVRPDTPISYLPYYGRSYTAPINPTDAGINFTSMNFEYSVKNKKKNRWEITIKPKDVNDIRDLNLTVYDNGRATLRVNSNNKDAMTFDGYLEPGK